MCGGVRPQIERCSRTLPKRGTAKGWPRCDGRCGRTGMSQSPDIGRVSLQGLSRRELEILATNARRRGRDDTADRAEAELRRRGNAAPQPSVRVEAARRRHPPPASPVHAGVQMPDRRLAAGLAALLALAALVGGGVLLRSGGVAREPPVVVATAPAVLPEPPAMAPTGADGPLRTSPTVDAPLAHSPPVRRAPAPADEAAKPRLPARSPPRPSSEGRQRLAAFRSEAAEAPEPQPAAILASSGSVGGLLARCPGGDRDDASNDCAAPPTHRTAYPAPTPARVVVARNMPPLALSDRRAGSPRKPQ